MVADDDSIPAYTVEVRVAGGAPDEVTVRTLRGPSVARWMGRMMVRERWRHLYPATDDYEVVKVERVRGRR